MELKSTIFIFDVDSTLISGESLEDIIKIAVSKSKDKQNIITRLQNVTNAGMEGKIDFRKSLEKRFEIVQILKKHVELFNREILLNQIDLVFKDIINIIKGCNGKVFIISAGFKDSIILVADKLGVEKDNCFTNEFIIKGEKIVGFNKKNPLSESDGKVKIVQEIKKNNKRKKIICIGDGNSDYLIRKEGVANEFWGFWGNVRRKNIEKKADRNFYSSKELLKFIKSLK